MKKILLFIFLSLSICLGLFNFSSGLSITAESVDNNNSIELIKISYGQNNTFVYLFPVNSKKLEEIGVDSISLEGFKFYLKGNVSVLKDAYEEKAKEIEDMKVEDVKYYTDYDAVGFEIEFSSLDAYSKFFGSGGSKDDIGNIKNSGLFTTRTDYEIKFPFSLKSAEAFRKMYSNLVTTWAATFEIDDTAKNEIEGVFEDTSFTYELVSTSGQIHSDNTFEKDGLTYNIFEKNYSELQENEYISFYTVKVNKGWWYFFALVATLVITIICFIVIKLKNKVIHKSWFIHTISSF